MTPLAAMLVTVCVAVNGALGQSAGMERINECATRCSQGLQCKTKPSSLFPRSCRPCPEGLDASSLMRNVSFSTAVHCEGRQKCSLHLRVKTALRLAKPVHGVSICTFSTGMLESCQQVIFSRDSRERMEAQQVEVESDCFNIMPGQEVRIKVKTVPDYCGVTWTGFFHGPECSSGNLRSHIPQCITGRLGYKVNPEKKEITVNVTDMLEGCDYRLRLCHKDYICSGKGASTLIKSEQPLKMATLPYARPLPCLCIEGWSVVSDAPRVQVCPFKDCLSELWRGVTFDVLEEALSWEPECPVDAVISLCQMGDDDVTCADLPDASRAARRERITFSKVEPHPKLCMKFTTAAQSWTSCPFAKAGFQAIPAWEVSVSEREGRQQIELSSPVAATFSVETCTKSKDSSVCRPITTSTLHVTNRKPVRLTPAGILYEENSCLQVRRLDVTYSATVRHCHLRYMTAPNMVFSRVDKELRAHKGLTWVLLADGVILAAVTICLLLHLMLTVYRRRIGTRTDGCDKRGKHRSLCSCTDIAAI